MRELWQTQKKGYYPKHDQGGGFQPGDIAETYVYYGRPETAVGLVVKRWLIFASDTSPREYTMLIDKKFVKRREDTMRDINESR